MEAYSCLTAALTSCTTLTRIASSPLPTDLLTELPARHLSSMAPAELFYLYDLVLPRNCDLLARKKMDKRSKLQVQGCTPLLLYKRGIMR
nr:uncharacterized protein CTRU02_14711 [Colletotrichum truncatum]KAF6781927.1 hypothetical protein CTRU02_14711 [Colletotrichum truncatum]